MSWLCSLGLGGHISLLLTQKPRPKELGGRPEVSDTSFQAPRVEAIAAMSICSFGAMPIYEVAEEPRSERFSDLPKATQQEGAELGFPPLLLAERLACPHGSL